MNIQARTYIQSHIHIALHSTHVYTKSYTYCFAHMYICTITQIHTKLACSVFYLLYGALSFWFYKAQEKFSSSKAIFILNTQCCNIIILVPIQLTARKYKKLQLGRVNAGSSKCMIIQIFKEVTP